MFVLVCFIIRACVWVWIAFVLEEITKIYFEMKNLMMIMVMTS